MSLRDTIIAARDLREETVEVPEWGASFRLVEMDGAERMGFDDESAGIKESGKKEDGLRLAARLLVRCIRDESGARVVGDDDADVLVKKNPKVLMRLFRRVAELNTATEKEVEAAAGKSEGAPSAG